MHPLLLQPIAGFFLPSVVGRFLAWHGFAACPLLFCWRRGPCWFFPSVPFPCYFLLASLLSQLCSFWPPTVGPCFCCDFYPFFSPSFGAFPLAFGRGALLLYLRGRLLFYFWLFLPSHDAPVSTRSISTRFGPARSLLSDVLLFVPFCCTSSSLAGPCALVPTLLALVHHRCRAFAYFFMPFSCCFVPSRILFLLCLLFGLCAPALLWSVFLAVVHRVQRRRFWPPAVRRCWLLSTRLHGRLPLAPDFGSLCCWLRLTGIWATARPPSCALGSRPVCRCHYGLGAVLSRGVLWTFLVFASSILCPTLLTQCFVLLPLRLLLGSLLLSPVFFYHPRCACSCSASPFFSFPGGARLASAFGVTMLWVSAPCFARPCFLLRVTLPAVLMSSRLAGCPCSAGLGRTTFSSLVPRSSGPWLCLFCNRFCVIFSLSCLRHCWRPLFSWLSAVH